MKRTKQEKGITLVALIITIIVLLILAVVAIRAVTGDGIIAHAKNAQTGYEDAQAKEESILSYYNEYLETKGNMGPWKQEENNITMKDDDGNPINIPIGAKVNYDPTAGVTDSNLLQYTSSSAKTGAVQDQVFKASNTLEWRVLGIEHGKIMLVASKGIAPVDTANEDAQLSGYELVGKNAYNNVIQELNNICATFGYGKGAESARSISGADIEKIAGITENDKRVLSGAVTYGSKYIYEYVDGSIKLSENGGSLENLENQKICFPDEVINSENPGPKTVTTNHFYMNITERIKNDNLKDIILNGEEVTWISEKTVSVVNSQLANYERGDIIFGMRIIDGRNGIINNYVSVILYNSKNENEQYSENIVKVRPVIILKADTELVEQTTENGVTTWNIQ